MAKRILLALLSLVVLGVAAAIVYSWLTFKDWQKLPGGFWLLAATAVGGGWAVLTHLNDVAEGFKAILQLPRLLAGLAEPRRYRQGEKPKASKAPASVPAANEVLPKGSKGPDFRYNPNFVGRQADLIELGRLLVNEDHPQPVVISGTGGAGKTQLAVEFCYRYGNRFEGVHWIQANRPEDIESGIAACGMVMDFESWPDKLAEQVQVTLNAWHDTPKRLVVLDNLEEPEALRTWLARLGSVRVLVTARRESWPTALGVQLHPLPLLDRADSLKLLRTQAERLYQLPDERLNPIADRLGDLPLALELAGRYLACRERLTPEGYLQELSQVGGAVGHISQREAGKNSATGHSGSLADTFMLSWQALDAEPADTEQVAVVQLAQLLFKMAGWCAPNSPIPLDVLRKGACGQPKADEAGGVQKPATSEEKAALSDANFGDATFDLALQGLYDLGLLSKTPDGPLIHPLLADFAQTLQTDSATQQEPEHSLADLCRALEQISDKALGPGLPVDFLPLRAHLETAVHFAEACQTESAGALWNNLGCYLNMIADFRQAKTCFERALAINEKVFGPEHPNVAFPVNNLGHVLQELSDLGGAKELFEQALGIDEKAYGSEHPNVARDVSRLGQVLQNLGDLKGAKERFERALVIDEKANGAEHPDVAGDISNLGSVLGEQGNLVEAKERFERALVIIEKSHGPEHPNVATIVNHLGLVLKDLGDLKGAKEYFERALAIDEKTYGTEHPNVARDINNLGLVLKDLGDLKRAKKHFEQALAIDEMAYGPENPYVATIINNLGLVLKALGDLAGAKERFERALCIFNKFLPADHTRVRIVCENLEGLNAQLAAQKKDQN